MTSVVGAIERIKKEGPSNLIPMALFILNALKNAKTIFERATILKDHRDFLTRGMFELLTGTPIEADKDGKVSYVHKVSGSLRVLSLFRIVSVTEANVESDFISSLLIPFAIPNSPRPAQPLTCSNSLPVKWSRYGLPRSRVQIFSPPPPPSDPSVSVKIRVP